MKEIKFFPITFFASVMGLSGYVIAFSRLNEIFQLGQDHLAHFFIYAVTVWFFIVLIFYFLKLILYREEVKKDIHHPIRIHFIPTISISLVLLSIAFQKISKDISFIFWFVGSFLHFVILLFILNRWFFHDFKINFKNPSWFIPVVGPILIPISGVNFSYELSWFFYSIGITLWIPLLAILLYRLIFHEPMPIKLLPTFTILLAPPAVAFISYIRLVEHLDIFAKILFYFGVFMFLMLITFLQRFIKISFFLSWWAYTFPLAAFTISVILYYNLTKILFFNYMSIVLFILTTIVIVVVLIKTIQSAIKGEIFVEE